MATWIVIWTAVKWIVKIALLAAVIAGFAYGLWRIIKKMSPNAKEEKQNNPNAKVSTGMLDNSSTRHIASVKEQLREKAIQMPRLQQEMVLLLDGGTGLQALEQNMINAAKEGNSSFFISCADSFLRKCAKLDKLNQEYSNTITVSPQDAKLVNMDSGIKDYVQRLSCPFQEKDRCEELLSLGKDLRQLLSAGQPDEVLRQFSQKYLV